MAVKCRMTIRWITSVQQISLFCTQGDFIPSLSHLPPLPTCVRRLFWAKHLMLPLCCLLPVMNPKPNQRYKTRCCGFSAAEGLHLLQERLYWTNRIISTQIFWNTLLFFPIFYPFFFFLKKSLCVIPWKFHRFQEKGEQKLCEVHDSTFVIASVFFFFSSSAVKSWSAPPFHYSQSTARAPQQPL